MALKTLTKREVLALNEAIKAIEGRLEECKDGDGKFQCAVVKPYDLESKAVYALARTKSKIDSVVNAIEREQRSILIKALKEKDTPRVQLDEDNAVVLDSTVEIEVFEFPIEHLKVSTNKLSPNLICALFPVLTGEL